MEPGKPSRTAWGAAAHRGAHQALDQGFIFADSLALRILGDQAGAVIRDAEDHPARRGMRWFIAARTRFAEDALAAAVDRGVRQLVVLGAGLDTFAYRNQLGVRVFEVDHPSTQAWKRARLDEVGIGVPDSLTFAPVDFETETLAHGLAAAGFDRTQAAFFTWLGVVPYLSEDAVWSTLRFIAGLESGAQVVFDYADPPASMSAEWRAHHDRRAAHVAELGEAWVTYFDAAELRRQLLGAGFSEVEDLALPQIAARYIPMWVGMVPEKGGHVVRAAVGGAA